MDWDTQITVGLVSSPYWRPHSRGGYDLLDPWPVVDYMITFVRTPLPVETLPFEGPYFWRVLARMHRVRRGRHSTDAIAAELRRRTKLNVPDARDGHWTPTAVRLAFRSFFFHHAFYTEDAEATQVALSMAVRLIKWNIVGYDQMKKYVGDTLSITSCVEGDHVPLYDAMPRLWRLAQVLDRPDAWA